MNEKLFNFASFRPLGIMGKHWVAQLIHSLSHVESYVPKIVEEFRPTCMMLLKNLIVLHAIRGMLEVMCIISFMSFANAISMLMG